MAWPDGCTKTITRCCINGYIVEYDLMSSSGPSAYNAWHESMIYLGQGYFVSSNNVVGSVLNWFWRKATKEEKEKKGKGKNLFKLSIPLRYIKMFEIVDLEEITVKVDGNQYCFNKHNFTNIREEWDFKSSFYPDSWYKEIPEPQEDYVKKIINNYQTTNFTSMILKTTDGAIKVIHRLDDGMIEADKSLSIVICNLESRIQHIHNNWGIVNCLCTDLQVLDDLTFTELNRYFVYSKNWLNDAGSSGGGNVTGLLSSNELLTRVGTLQTHEKVGPKNYRLTQQFIKKMGEAL